MLHFPAPDGAATMNKVPGVGRAFMAGLVAAG
jgi:hypothetical protein